MGCEIKNKEINGTKYETQQLAPSVALPKIGGVIKVCGPVLGIITQATKSAAGKTAKAKEAALMDAVHSMATELATIDPDGLSAVLKDLCEQARVGGTKVNYDSHFGEYPADLFPVALFVLEANFTRFLPASLQGFAKLMEAGSESPKA